MLGLQKQLLLQSNLSLDLLGSVSASAFASGPAPTGFHWDFVTYSGARVTYLGAPVVALVAN